MFDLYKNTAIGDATTYVRPYQTISDGPLGGQNSICIFEEMIVILPDASAKKVVLDTPPIQYVVTDPSQVFNVVDPTTGATIGTKTLAALKIEMYSLYLYLAALRDAG